MLAGKKYSNLFILLGYIKVYLSQIHSFYFINALLCQLEKWLKIRVSVNYDSIQFFKSNYTYIDLQRLNYTKNVEHNNRYSVHQFMELSRLAILNYYILNIFPSKCFRCVINLQFLGNSFPNMSTDNNNLYGNS